MGVMTDRVVIDYSNGRASLWMSIEDEQPFLHWLILGHNESVDLWLKVQLDWSEADEFLEQPPLDVNQFVTALSPRNSQFTWDQDGVELVALNVSIPGPTGQPIVEGLNAMRAALSQIVLAKGKLAEPAQTAVAALSAA